MASIGQFYSRKLGYLQKIVVLLKGILCPKLWTRRWVCMWWAWCNTSRGFLCRSWDSLTL